MRKLLPELRGLPAEEGVEAEIELRVETIEGAARERFLGSPTVRVNGADVDPGAPGRDDFGLRCRLYRDEEGISRTPPERWIREAIGASRLT